MADELKQLPSSTVAALLRQAQEAARGVGDDESRSWLLRGPAKVADALIGRSPEHFDDVASGMFRLKRPSYQQSWAGANEPLVDALGITPTPDVGKAALLGGPMLKALGKTDEWKHAVDVVRRTGTPPPGWVVHPGKAAPEVSVMKYEATPWDDKELDTILNVIDKGDPRTFKIPMSRLAPGSEVVRAYDKFLAAHPMQATTQGMPKELLARVIGERIPGGSEAGYGIKQGIRAQLGTVLQDEKGRVGSSGPRPFAMAGLKSLLEHELTHASQTASNLPQSMRGANPANFDLSPDQYQSFLDASSNISRGIGKPDFSSEDKIEDFARNVRTARQQKMIMRPESAYDMYAANPGEAVARAMERMEFNRSMRFDAPSAARTNYDLRQQMQRAEADSRAFPGVNEIDREMFDLWKRLDAQRQLRSTVQQQGPKP